MIEVIRQIPGPSFLLYYAGFVAFSVIIGRFWIHADHSLNYPMPNLTRCDTISLSFLRGGRADVIRTAVFDLWRRGLVSIGGARADVTLKQAQVGKNELSSKLKNLKPVVHMIYRFLVTERKSAELFRSEELKSSLDLHLQLVERELAQLHLLKTDEDLTRSIWVVAAILVVMLVPGLVKVSLGIARGKPVSFLLLVMVIAIVILGLTLKPWSKTSGLGRRYLRKLTKDFGWIKDRIRKKGMGGGIDPAFAVAVFGPAVLGAGLGYEEYKSAFQKSSGFSCGGCSGSSGCSGGGGCGGGGCGGGGCGGCGG